MKAINVVVADDHAVMREGLKALLETEADISVAGLAGTGREVLTLAVTHQPDVVIMDLAMPELNGIEATSMLRRRQPQIGVIMLTPSMCIAR